MNLPALALGRFLFCLPFMVFGVLHFMNAGAMAAIVPAWVPGGGTFWVYFTGFALIAAPLAVITGKQAKLASQLLALLMLVFVFALQLPGVLAGGEGAAAAMAGLLKDTALAGGALLMAHLSE